MPVLLAGPPPAWSNAYDPGAGKFPVEFDGPPGPFQMQNTFEAFPVGNPVTNSTVLVAPGDNQWAFTSQNGGIPVVVSNPTAHGGRAMCCAATGSGTNCAAAWGSSSSNNQNPAHGNIPVITQPLYFRFYVYLTGIPSTSLAAIARLAPTSASGNGAFGLQYLNNGVLRATYNNNNNIAVGGWVPPLQTWLRVEAWTTIDPNFAQCQLTGYVGDSLTPIFSGTSAAAFSQAPITSAFFGVLGSSTATYTLFMDDIALGNQGLFGPSGTQVNDYDQPLSAQVSPSFQVAQQPWKKPQIQYDYSYQNLAFSNNAETGPAGQTATVLNSRGAGQSGFPNVNTTGGNITYDVTQAAHGTQSFLINQTSDATVTLPWLSVNSLAYNPAFGQLPAPPVVVPLYYRFYVYLTGYPAGGSGNFLLRMPPANNGIEILPAGNLALLFNGAVRGSTSPGPVPLFTWVRVEGWYQAGIGGSNPSNGGASYTAYLYDSLTPIWPTFTLTGQATGANGIQQVLWGNPSPNGSQPYFWMDDVAVSTAGLIGPAGSNTTIADQPLTALTGPAWRNAFSPVQRQQVEGYADAPSVTFSGSATALLGLLASAAGRKIASGSPSSLIFLLAYGKPQRVYTFRATAQGARWTVTLLPASTRWGAQSGGL